MAVIKRHRVSWAGAPVVGPGLTTFYESPEAAVGGADDIEAFFTAVAGLCPTGLQWTIPSNGDLIDSVTGELVGSWSDPGTGGVVAASGSSIFTNGVGARVVWNTGGTFSGRRVRGATFVVPLSIEAYEGAGNLTGTVITQLTTAAANIVDSDAPFVIWSRSTTSATGEVNAITSATIPDRVSWLRSRRT